MKTKKANFSMSRVDSSGMNITESESDSDFSQKQSVLNQVDQNLEILPDLSTKPTTTPPNKTERSILSNADLAELYANCTKLSAQGRINQANTWNLNLIDHMASLIQPDDQATDFLKASATIDAGIQIYSSRIDSVHEDTFRVLSSLAQQKTNSSSKTPDDGSNSDSEPDLPKQKKKKRIFSNILSAQQLNMNLLDNFSTEDPSQLFTAFGRGFDEETFSSLLLYQKEFDISSGLDLELNLRSLGLYPVLIGKFISHTNFKPDSKIQEISEDLLKGGLNNTTIMKGDITKDLDVTEFTKLEDIENSEQFDSSQVSINNYNNNNDNFDNNEENNDNDNKGFLHLTLGRKELNINNEDISIEKNKNTNEWAGAKHWKFNTKSELKSLTKLNSTNTINTISSKPNSKSQNKENKENIKKSKIKENINFETDIAEVEKMLLKSVEKSIPTININSNNSLNIHELPEDLRIKPSRLQNLFTLDLQVLNKSTENKSISNLAQSMMQNFSMDNNTVYDYNNKNDQSFCSGNNNNNFKEENFKEDNVLNIEFDIVPKHLDVGSLKRKIWRNINEGKKEKEFENVIGELKENVDEQFKGDITEAYCFVCILHLANENNLELKEKEGNNFEIKVGECNVLEEE